MTADNEDRIRYRLPPQERIGWLFGLNTMELIVAIISVTGAALLAGRGSIITASIGFVLGISLTAPLFGGQSALSRLPFAWRWLRLSRKPETWCTQIPILGDSEATAPSVLADQRLIAVDAEASPTNSDIGLVHDHRNGTLAITLRVQGQGFLLHAADHQDWLLAQWGVALAGCVNERKTVTAITWSETAAPTGLENHRNWIDEQKCATPVDAAVASYEEVLDAGAGSIARHEVLVTLTVDATKAKLEPRHEDDPLRAGIELATTEARALTQRLQAAGLTVSTPLTATELARSVQERLDPTGAVTSTGWWPTTTQTALDWWRADTTYHRALHIAEWPRLDVVADWMKPVLLHTDCARTVTIVIEPITASASRRRIRTQMSRIGGDANLRGQHGYRVTADHHRAQQAVEEREHELVAGFSEVTYAGIITLAAATTDDLDAATADLTQVAATAGIRVAPLHGRHDQAIAVTLPTARTLAPHR